MNVNLHPPAMYPNGIHRDNFTFSVNNKLGIMRK